MALLHNYYHVDVNSDQYGVLQSDAAKTSGVSYIVYDVGTRTEATIYATNDMGAKTNPVTTAVYAVDKSIKFWSAAASCDVVVMDNYGIAAFTITPVLHAIQMPGVAGRKCIKFPYANTATVETDTGIDLPARAVVTDIFIETITNVAASTIDIGTLSTESGGDANGFVAASVAPVTASLINALLPALTTGSSETYISAIGYVGVLLTNGVPAVGTDANTDCGIFHRVNYFAGDNTAKSISYTTNDKAVAGYVYIFYFELL